MINLDEKLRKAINKASEKYPCYAYSFDCVRYEWTTENSTMSMNKDLVLHCNKKFVESIPTIEDLSELVTHEVLHYLLNHFARYAKNMYKDTLSFKIHNIAMDYEINSYLNSDWINKNGMLPQNEKYPIGLSYEEYLHYLYRDPEQNNELGSGNTNDIPGSIENPGDLSDNEIDDLQEQVKNAISQNLTRSNEYTLGESEAVSTIREVKPKPFKWDSVLRNIISSKCDMKTFGFDNHTYLVPNKRLSSISKDILFPSRYSLDNEFYLVIGIDISGSMGDLVNEMYARVKSLLSMIDSSVKTTIIECDTAIVNMTHNFNFNSESVESHFGGGTDLNAIPKWVKENVNNKKITEPDVIIIMTDNYCNWDLNALYYKKTIVLTNNISKKCPYKQIEVSI